MIGLFRPLEECVCSSVVTVDAQGFVFFVGKGKVKLSLCLTN
jgi:hypothetical protein